MKHESLISENELEEIRNNGKDVNNELVKKMIRSKLVRKPEYIKEDLSTLHALRRIERFNMKQMRDIRIAVIKYKDDHKDKNEDDLVIKYEKRRKKNKKMSHLELLKKEQE
jgi:hypothetical protein